MKRERRSLWTSISTSKKVNALSAPAVILYTFAIPHFDDEGFMDGDPRIIKSQIVPLRDDVTIEMIPHLVAEISTIHDKVGSQTALWIIHKESTDVYIQDPVFDERQSFRGIHKSQSKIKLIVEKLKKKKKDTIPGAETVPDGCDIKTAPGAETVHKLSEVKLSEEKGSEGVSSSRKEFLEEQKKQLGVA